MKLLINLVLNEYDKSELAKVPLNTINSQKGQRNIALINLLKSGKNTINSSEILELAAPEDSYDFFISHSHKDIDSVLSLASFLRNKGFKVFVDSEYWLYFDDIAKELNKNHLHGGESGTDYYDHDKTIDVQKHCDVMLSASLLQIMTKSKVLVFVNTPSSIVNMEELSQYDAKRSTYSPWIYYEILVANALFEPISYSNLLEHYTRDSVPQIMYDNVDLNNMINKTWEDFKTISWKRVIETIGD